MATPHCSHLLPWQNLLDILRKRDTTAIDLPVGVKCGKIHISSTEMERQISRRSYITDSMVCQDASCNAGKMNSRKHIHETPSKSECNQKEAVHEGTLLQAFGKKREDTLPIDLCRFSIHHGAMPQKVALTSLKQVRNLRQFCDGFVKTVQMCAKQELEVLTTRYTESLDMEVQPEYLQRCVNVFHGEEEHKHEDDKSASHVCSDFTVEYALMVESLSMRDDLARLLYLDRTGELSIRGALGQMYGTQAVGNGIRFLLYHLLLFYIYTNVIVGANYHNHPEKWGLMELQQRIATLGQDCDFYTFVPAWRKELKLEVDGTYIVDWAATHEVLRKVYRFFVVLEVLCQRMQMEPIMTRSYVCSSIGLMFRIDTSKVESFAS